MVPAIQNQQVIWNSSILEKKHDINDHRVEKIAQPDSPPAIQVSFCLYRT